MIGATAVSDTLFRIDISILAAYSIYSMKFVVGEL